MNKPIFKILASALLFILGFAAGNFYNKSITEPKNEIVRSGSDFEMIQKGVNGTYKWIILSKKQPNGKWESVWDIFNDVEDVK